PSAMHPQCPEQTSMLQYRLDRVQSGLTLLQTDSRTTPCLISRAAQADAMPLCFLVRLARVAHPQPALSVALLPSHLRRLDHLLRWLAVLLPQFERLWS